MTVQSEPCWNFPVTSINIPGDHLPPTTVRFPVSPTSVTATTMSSPPSTASFPPLTPDVPPRPANRNRSRKQYSRLSTPSSSLPNPKELSIEDDWTRVKCPKEKKRIQNRVAQRTYRHRMKAKLGELQARLDNHERQRMEQIAHSTGDVPNVEAVSSGHLNLNTTMTSNLGSMDGLNSFGSVPLTQRGVGVGSSPLAHERQRASAMLQEHGVEEKDSTFYPHNAPYLQSPPNSQPSPQGPNDLLSPPARADFEPSGKVSQDFVLDCLQFQGQLVNGLNTAEHDAPYSRQTQYGSPNSSLTQAMDSISRGQVGCMSSLAPTHVHNLDYSFDGSRDDDWRTDAFGLKTRSCPSPMGQMSFAHMAEPVVIPALEPMVWKDSRTCTTEERVESVMRQAHEAGFDTFEDFATAYYKTDLNKASPLSTEQHLSRSKRLPRVVSDVYQAAETWPQWERRGFCQQILATAATMLTSEASARDGHLAYLLQKQDVSRVSEGLELMGKRAQQELPYSWTLNKALVEEGDVAHAAEGPGSSSYIALATVLLQRCSGRVPREQLLRVVEACI
ncbi:hypothetical protein E4U42_005842 [Claviceps africana]|uniref:BZIP domain-containing protein n=1 Tax=Claviceps africana TaxID=83212 RepID=A0A8K0J610_9HYPO|nr:hypothetical protein E4U42_005842 [Claviceps africana]